MPKPKKLYLPEDAKYSGADITIDIAHIKSANTLSIGAWYDGMVGTSGNKIHLADFFDKLGITEKDCRQAFSLLNLREFNKL